VYPEADFHPEDSMEYLIGMSQAMKQAQADNNSESYRYVAAQLVQSKNDIRQAIEQATAEAIAAIIGKLEDNQPLDEAEKQTVKLWVVGDAEGYVKMENSLQEWLEEYRRLLEVIAAGEGQTGSVQELVEMHGVLEDAIEVTNDLAHFLEDRERVARCETALRSPTAEDNKFLAGMLKSMLASPGQ
jgi:DNA-binding FadR family transcriptional regulator